MLSAGSRNHFKAENILIYIYIRQLWLAGIYKGSVTGAKFEPKAFSERPEKNPGESTSGFCLVRFS